MMVKATGGIQGRLIYLFLEHFGKKLTKKLEETEMARLREVSARRVDSPACLTIRL
jgi:hypothetical protein